jgi:AraC-like DNA-binding protein
MLQSTLNTKSLASAETNEHDASYQTHNHTLQGVIAMGKETVAAGFPKAFFEFAVARGANRQALIRRSNLDLNDLKDQDNRVPLENYVALMKAGIELCDEPALALLFGEAVRMHDVSIVGLIGEAGDCGESGQQQINRYAPLLIDDGEDVSSDRIVFVRDNGNFWMEFRSPVYVDQPLLTESGFARCVCSARAMFKSGGILIKAPFPKAIHFTHDEPSYRAEYDRIFGVPLIFRSHINALLFDGEVLSVKPPGTNPYLSQILTARAEELLKRLETSKSTRARVEALLLSVLPSGQVNIETIASKLGLSRQTLFRKLKAESVTFEQVLVELRLKLALEYLGEKKTSVSEAAYLLGFSDPAAFSRAFKRWAGCSPRTIAGTKPKRTVT